MFDKKEAEIRKQEIFSKIRPLIASVLKIEETRITPKAEIGEDLGADSLDAIEIVMALEETFNIEILDEEQEKIKTIEDILVYLADKIKE